LSGISQSHYAGRFVGGALKGITTLFEQTIKQVAIQPHFLAMSALRLNLVAFDFTSPAFRATCTRTLRGSLEIISIASIFWFPLPYIHSQQLGTALFDIWYWGCMLEGASGEP
jgi:hypothetical protein